ncbi:hypothetical protein LTSEMIS_0569, partial [Salmonella enterica subsp. enterica serovar Mississippi str. A4-633]
MSFTWRERSNWRSVDVSPLTRTLMSAVSLLTNNDDIVGEG